MKPITEETTENPETVWRELVAKTANHAWDCACPDCEMRLLVAREATRRQDREFTERAARIESYRRSNRILV